MILKDMETPLTGLQTLQRELLEKASLVAHKNLTNAEELSEWWLYHLTGNSPSARLHHYYQWLIHVYHYDIDCIRYWIADVSKDL